MRRSTVIFLLATLPVLAIPTGGRAAPTAAPGGHDIGALMATAQESFDLSGLDAVVLLDELTVVFEEDGTVRRTTHSVVWFSTELGLDTYADLRVPYNTATSELEVQALRTWRDGTWWPHETELSPTAIVVTTPYAAQSADDYTTMREVMLLHDGVELPCIVETAYTITERRDPALGSDGLWVVPGSDPTVLKALTVTMPGGHGLHWTKTPGAPEPEVMRSPEHGTVHRWVAELVDRRPRPLSEDPVAHLPFVVWSTWGSWEALGVALVSAVDGAALVTQELADSVAAVTDGLPFALSRADAVVAFMRETTRPVHHDDSFWQLAPRPADRTWETAYGHRLDMAALATTLLREAGCDVTPVFRTPGRAAVDGAVPALAWFADMDLMVEGDGLAATLDPLSGGLRHGDAGLAGHTEWLAGSDPLPRRVQTGTAASSYELAVSLAPDGENGWGGAGLLRTSGSLSAHSRMTGLSGESGSFLAGVARSIIAGASGEEDGVSEFTPERVTAALTVELDQIEPDYLGRTRIVIGDPSGGVLSAMPGDVHTYVERRDSPVLLPGPLTQTVTLRFDPGDRELVRLPEARELENPLGRFSVDIEEKPDGTVVVSRSLSIGEVGGEAGGASVDREGSYGGLLIEAGQWPALRELLLEEADPRNRTLLLK